MIDETSDSDFRDQVSGFVRESASDELHKSKDLKSQHLLQFEVSDEDFQTIKVQLRALGLITKSTKPRSVKDTQTYWTLTPYGDTVMTRLRAIPRSHATKDEPAS